MKAGSEFNSPSDLTRGHAGPAGGRADGRCLLGDGRADGGRQSCASNPSISLTPLRRRLLSLDDRLSKASESKDSIIKVVNE